MRKRIAFRCEGCGARGFQPRLNDDPVDAVKVVVSCCDGCSGNDPNGSEGMMEFADERFYDRLGYPCDESPAASPVVEAAATEGGQG